MARKILACRCTIGKLKYAFWKIKLWKGKYEINTNFTFWQKELILLSPRAGLFPVINSTRHPTLEK
jgi:hypothetical protein